MDLRAQTAAILRRALARGRSADETPAAWDARRRELTEALAEEQTDEHEHDLCPVAVTP